MSEKKLVMLKGRWARLRDRKRGAMQSGVTSCSGGWGEGGAGVEVEGGGEKL